MIFYITEMNRDGVNLTQALGWNLGTCHIDVKGEIQSVDL